MAYRLSTIISIVPTYFVLTGLIITYFGIHIGISIGKKLLNFTLKFNIKPSPDLF